MVRLLAAVLLVLHTTSTTAAAAATVAPPAAIDLRVEYAETPVHNVGARQPRFSWSLVHPQRGAAQHAFRVTVHEVGPAAVVWDSGVVKSNATLGVRCDTALRSDIAYQLTVVWSDATALWASPAVAHFSTALLAQSDWDGVHWLTLPDGNDTRSQFRATLALPLAKTVSRATCFISGLGYARSFLNGIRLASSPEDTLGPFMQFQRRVAYDTFDVTNQLRGGNNTLAVQLGHGWFALPDDAFTAVLGYRTVGHRSLRVLCKVALSDGSSLRFATGDSEWVWRHGAGELRSDHLFLGETIDKRQATPGWLLSSFDDSSWDLAQSPRPVPPPPPPPTPKIGLKCPAGQHVDWLEEEGDNGSCDCDEYCATDWVGSLKTRRPSWTGATSVYNYTRGSALPQLVCVCVQATHWCDRKSGVGCGGSCRIAGGTPSPRDFCVPDSTPPPAPPPAPGGSTESTPIGHMVSLLISPVRRHEPRSPVAIRQPLGSKDGTWVLDFEVNQAMQCSLKIDTDGTMAGTTLMLRHAEQVDSSGNIVISNDLGNQIDRTTFILGAHAGTQEFETYFSYFGARFVELTGWPSDSRPTTDSMTCFFVHTALPQRSAIHFKSSPESRDTAVILNGIHDITVRSALSNFMSTPTDCPSREKRGWTGDGQAAAETLIYNFDMSTTYPKWIADIAHAQQCNFHAVGRNCSEEQPFCRVEGDGSGVTEIAPFLFGGRLDGCSAGGDPAWSSGFIALIDWVHRYYGDRQVLEQHYEGGKVYLEQSLLPHVNTSDGGSSLLDLTYPVTHYGDWCAPIGSAPTGSGPAIARHTSNLINGFYWLKQLRIMTEAAETLGKMDDVKQWATLAKAGAASFVELYFDKVAGKFRDIECSPGGRQHVRACHNTSIDSEMSVQTAQALPLFLGLPPAASDRKRAGDALAADVLKGAFPGRTTTGLVGTKYFLSELVAAGHADVAITVATSMEYPSWGRMLPPSVHPLGQGEGTLWEQFGGTAHEGFGSRNHIMLGGFEGPFFYGNLAGIRNAGMAWSRTLIAPTVAGNLTGVTATVGTVRGNIDVEWSASGTTCGEGSEDGEVCVAPAVLSCVGQGSVITTIKFVDYGVPTGECGSFAPGNCSAASKESMDVVKKLCLGRKKSLAIEATCSGYFALSVTLPVGVVEGQLRLPLLGRSPTSAVVKEGNAVVFAHGKFNPGAAAGVNGAVADEVALSGAVIAVAVESGSYSFTME